MLWAACIFLVQSSCSTTNRFEEEIATFEKQDRQEGYQNDFVLFTGSSSIRLWKTLESDMEGLNVLNRGFGGATLRELNMHWSRIAGKHQPALVVLYCGENDIAEGASVEETLEHFHSYMEKYRNTYAEVPLIYIAMKPSPSRMAFWADYQEADELIKAIIEDLPNTYFIDLGSTMYNEAGKLKPEIFEADSLHMNALGYQGWTEKLRPLMEVNLE